MLTLEQLRVFVSVQTSGSFSKAADLLGQTPSAISKKISQLEKELNLQLFTRTTRRITLTSEGELISQQAHKALSAISDIEESAALTSEIPQGKIKVDAPTPFLEHCIIPHLNDFIAAYPNVEIEFASFDKQIDLITEQVDVAFRIGQLKDSSLHYRSIGRTKLRILASPDYIVKHGLPKNVDELGNHQCIGFSQPASLNRWPLLTETSQIFEFTPKLLFSSGSLIKQAAITGNGIVCLADFMTKKDVQTGNLIQLLTNNTLDMYQDINAVFYKPFQSSLKIKCFIDFITKAIEKQL